GHVVIEVLDVQGRDLARDRQHLAAVVEVAGQLEPGHSPLRQQGRGLAGRDDPFRVLGELVHVDDVRDRAQLADRGEGPAPLDPGLEGQEEEDARADEHDVVDPGLQELDELEDLDRLVGAVQRDHGAHEAGGDDRHQGGHADTQTQDGSGDPGRSLPRLAGDALQLAAHAAEARLGKALVDALSQQRDRARDRLHVEGEVLAHGTRGLYGRRTYVGGLPPSRTAPGRSIIAGERTRGTNMVLDWLGGSKDADALMARRKYPQAIEALRQLLQKHGGDLRLRMKLADALVLAGREKEAAPVLLELADALAAEGQAAKSIALLKKVQKIDPGRADVEGKLADLIKTKERRTKGF